MRIDEFYLSQVRRFGGLNFLPQTPEAWTELAKILRRNSTDEKHGERIVTRWIETQNRCPSPSELGEHARNVPADAALDRPELPPACASCCDQNGLWMLVRHPNGKEGLQRCLCARGMKLAAMDAGREQSRKQPEPAKKLERFDGRRTASGERE